jgi:hypothetical protein
MNDQQGNEINSRKETKSDKLDKFGILSEKLSKINVTIKKIKSV